MDEDAELAGLSEHMGAKNGAIPAGAMLASPGDQTNRKVPLDTAPSDSKPVLGRPSQEPPLLPSRSGLSVLACFIDSLTGLLNCMND